MKPTLPSQSRSKQSETNLTSAGYTTNAQTNYFGKGNTTTYDRGGYSDVTNPQTTFHNYSLDWTSERIIWSIDSQAVRQLNYADAVGGANYPQTPMRIKMGNWVGGSSTAAKGTVEWAGGLTDFSDAPFTMYVQSVKIQDYSTGATSYSYGDLTGSFDSIVISKDGSSSSASGSSSSGSSSSGSKTAAGGSSASTVYALGHTSATASASSASASEAGVFAGSNSSSSSSSTNSSSAASASSTVVSSLTSAAAGKKPSRYGAADFVVVVLGLGLGYLVM